MAQITSITLPNFLVIALGFDSVRSFHVNSARRRR